MVVVDELDEWLDLAPLLDLLFRHPPGDFRGVALDAGDQGVGEWVLLCAGVLRLDYDDLWFVSVSEHASGLEGRDKERELRRFEGTAGPMPDTGRL